MGLLETAAKAYELAKKSGNIEAQEVIMQLREELLEKQFELSKLRTESENLQRAAERAKSVSYDAPYYWRSVGDEKDGPYCQLCHDKEDKLIRLQNWGKGEWFCHGCEN